MVCYKAQFLQQLRSLAWCSFNGFFLGQALTRFSRMDPILNVAGALVLIGIGCKILIEHQAFAGLL